LGYRCAPIAPASEEMEMTGQNVRVAVIAGSKSDQAVIDEVTKALSELEVDHEVKYLSAHRNPEGLRSYLASSQASVFVAVAGLAAHLPGVIASQTLKPVIGVPVNAKLNGLDSLLSIVQMPPGVPVGCVGIDNGRNAGILAAEILAIQDPKIRNKLNSMREAWR
jgi:5-(carboxyamino)imidazole ribonucleotide mutase